MSDEKNDNYEVGYGKPPKNTRFAKGRSGNPSGRPKGSVNLMTCIRKIANQKVRINTERGVRYIPKLEASLMQLANLAMGKNVRTIHGFVDLAHRAEEAAEGKTPSYMPDTRDEQVIDNLLKRILDDRKSEDEEENTEDPELPPEEEPQS